MIKLRSRRASALVGVLFSAGLIGSPGLASTPAEEQLAGLKLSAEGPEELFGNAVAPAGDVNGDGFADVLVGAPGVDSKGGEFSGRVYLFLGPLDAGRSAEDADAIFTAEGANDNLGFSIAAGDLNDDGKDDVILGARSNDSAGIQAGRVYVYFGPVTGTRSVKRADLKIAGKEFDEAGSAVAAGDLNGDAVDDLVIGAHNGSGPGISGAGQASVFFGPIARRKRSVTAADVSLTGVVFSEQFSGSLAIDDLDGDGLPDLVVGAPHMPVGSEGPGHAYVFVAPMERGARPASTADTILEGAQTSDSFGVAVATGDLNGDGQADLAVGADELFRRGSSGRAYVFNGPLPTGDQAASTADAVLVGEPANPNSDLFGNALAVTDHDGDGVDDLAIAGSSSDARGPRSGRACLFFGPPPASGAAADADLVITGRRFDLLGQSLADAGDLDGDGLEDLLLGAPGFADDEPDSYVRVLLGRPRPAVPDSRN